jgi:hypothetical protein
MDVIIIRHQLDLDSPVSASSNCLFKGLPNHLRPFDLQFSITFAILLLFLRVTFLLHAAVSLNLSLFFRKIFLISALQKFLHSLSGQKGASVCYTEKFHPN